METEKQGDSNAPIGEFKAKKGWTWERTIEVSKIVATSMRPVSALL